MKRTLLLISTMIFILTPLISLAATINVPTLGHPTIQTGIDASSDGDIVLLADGTYTGVGNYNIDFNGKSITVKSANEPDVCIVDCEGLGRGFLVYNGETVTFEGLTVKNGDAGEDNAGGGIYANESEIIVINCVFEDNRADAGGAVFSSSSTSSFTNCTFTSNSTESAGAVYSDSSSSFTNCSFTSNSADNSGAVAVHGTSTSFTNCSFTSNSAAYAGGAVTSNSSSSSTSFTNCTFTANNASDGGAVHYYHVAYDSSSFTNCSFTLNEATNQGGAIWCNIPLAKDPITLKNCILWGNIAPEGSEIYEKEKPLVITYSNIQGGHTGAGNIDTSPFFVHAESGNLHLLSNSPCIDTGTANGAPTDDLDGNPRPMLEGYDMGAYEVQVISDDLTIEAFIADPSTGVVPLTVGLTCIAYDNTYNITGYYWNFGDSYTETTSGGTVQHMYSTPGSFTATCTVANDSGDQTTASTTIEVTNDEPIADAGSDQIIPGNSVELDGSNSSDSDGTISSWEWALTHTENSAYDRTAIGEIVYLTDLEFGHYTVVLTVTDNFGTQGTDEMFLSVAGSDLKYTQTEYEQAQQVSHDNGYSEGHAAGFTEGYATGYSEGHSVGVTEGYATGYAEGHTAGVAEGHTTGYTEGYTAGYSEGHTAGYTEGYTAGQDNCSQCPIREDGAGNKFLDGPLTIEDNGLLTIQ